MSSTSETGHAKNVANFRELAAVCVNLGNTYNPAKASIKAAALTAKLKTADDAVKALNKVNSILTTAINERETVFLPLRQLASRINNAVAASDVPANLLTDVKTLTRKLQGKRATPKKDEQSADPANPGPKQISVSQLSYDSQVANLEKLAELLATQPGYVPNESNLSVAGLKALLTRMNTANDAVINAAKPVASARALRNTELYHAETGLVKTANNVKAYIKSMFAVKSPEYKQLSKLRFDKPREK